VKAESESEDMSGSEEDFDVKPKVCLSEMIHPQSKPAGRRDCLLAEQSAIVTSSPSALLPTADSAACTGLIALS